MSSNLLNFPIAHKHHICWGQDGLAYYGAFFAAIVIVDVFSFCTTVDIALSKGHSIIPTKIENKDHLLSLAQQHNATLVKKRNEPGITLSPSTLGSVNSKQVILLPSPNGSTLMDIASHFHKPVFSGCFRNTRALSKHLNFKKFFPILFVAAGERYPNKMLRPAIEDYWGVGSILASIDGDKTIEAECAIQSFKGIFNNVQSNLTVCESAQELIVHGYPQDVELAGECNISDNIAELSKVNDCLLLVPDSTTMH